MGLADVFHFAYRSLGGYRLRSGLTLLSMGIGVAAVVLLTSLGEGARVYVEDEFRSLGSNLLIVLPGRSETTGGPPPLLGETPRDLTLDDAAVLARCRAVNRIAPVSFGTAPVSYGNLEREAPILGTTYQMLPIRQLEMGYGKFLPELDLRRGASVCVLGPRLKEELFGARFPLGEWVRIADRRYRVIGVLASRGRSIGLDLQDMIVVPVSSAMALFDTGSLFRVVVEARSRADIPAARQCILASMQGRHDGEDDITVITQDSVLTTFNKILRALTLAVGGIAAISLSIAGILIMNVLLVSVSERRAEIGLLKALGATPGRILALFMAEAVFLATSGGLFGLVTGYAGVQLIGWLYPEFPVTVPLWAPVSGLGLSVAAGAVFGALPARRAAALDPVAALSRR